MRSEIYTRMSQCIVIGDIEGAVVLAQQSIKEGLDPLEVINQGYVVGINMVGEAFTKGEAFLPELVMAGEAMKAAVSVLEPELKRRGAERKTLGRVILATVEGDIHEIGKSLVGTMLSASGFEVFDLGVDVATEKILSKAKEVHANLIGLSALLTTTMVKQREVIDALEKSGMRETIKVIVGGAPVTRDWVQTIKADGYSEDAIGAVVVAKQLLRC